uniref:Tyrosine specific protein phosphatases domain-containing protein n=1 Tax=Dunaliella tertiolecta TaxID=3047 RepID=A0A7S3VR57_DUNTE|mmetsp:Transcript_22045/g.61041  ORF Transcript_22045/g.61041 Transcript_22045/m.61041 type:complete len:449 (+) Transcript_22045:49-1395(+)
MLSFTKQGLCSRAFAASPKLVVVPGLHKTGVLWQGVAPLCCTSASNTSQPTASAIGGMAAQPKLNLNVENFRDLAEANGAIKPGRVWRCARPSSASESDVCILLDQLGIRDLIDLRSSEELAEDPYYESYDQPTPKRTPRSYTLSSSDTPSASSLSTSSDTSVPASAGSSAAAQNTHDGQVGKSGAEPSTSSEAPPRNSPSGGTGAKNNKAGSEGGDGSGRPRTLFQGTQFRRYLRQWLSWQAYVDSKGPDTPVIHHQVSLLERNRYYRALLTHVPVTKVAAAMALGLLQFKEQSRLILLREVNAGGLALLYKIIVDSAKIEIRTVLDLICNSLENRRPVMFFCKAGKDRTGIIAALVLACSGATDLQIVDDYARSDAFHAVALAGIENKPELAGLDRAAFERAPAGAMRETIAYINQQYGSLAAYMTHIGFGPERQQQLRQLLTRDV